MLREHAQIGAWSRQFTGIPYHEELYTTPLPSVSEEIWQEVERIAAELESGQSFSATDVGSSWG